MYPVGHSLLSLKDDEWKRVRSILTPSCLNPILFFQSMEELDVYPVGHSLLSLKDDEWKRVRSILTPSFSSAKIKQVHVPQV